jgi:hypothetical protein
MGKKKKIIRVKRGWVWKCATNCYSKWFGGWPTKDLIPDFYEAAKRLNELEILWMDSYKDPRYMDWILYRWNATDIPMEHRRKTKNNAKQNYTKAEMKMLQDANWQDQLLYIAMRNKWTKMLNITLS